VPDLFFEKLLRVAETEDLDNAFRLAWEVDTG
jgi:hypothetical protein